MNFDVEMKERVHDIEAPTSKISSRRSGISENCFSGDELQR